MGHEHIDSLKPSTPTPIQERVEEGVRNDGIGEDAQSADGKAHEPMTTHEPMTQEKTYRYLVCGRR